ncbi:MAG: hypothetical protein WBM08_15690 [Prochlorococcaceae cyanobacterium]
MPTSSTASSGNSRGCRHEQTLQLRHAAHLLCAVADQRQRELALRYYRDVPDGRIHGLMRRASEIHLLRWLARAIESCCEPALVAAPPQQWPAAGDDPAETGDLDPGA